MTKKTCPLSLDEAIVKWDRTQGSEYKKSYRSKVGRVVEFLVRKIQEDTGKVFTSLEPRERSESLKKIIKVIKDETNRDGKKEIRIRAVYDFISKEKI